MPKTIYMALHIALAASFANSANAFTSTNCFWIGTTYTCTTISGGTMTTTRCTTIGSTVRCTQY